MRGPMNRPATLEWTLMIGLVLMLAGAYLGVVK